MDIKVDACSSDAIIKNHDGWISVDSELGKGATVRIFLPAIEAKVKTKEDFLGYGKASAHVFKHQHPGNAYSYRFEGEDGKVVVFCTDIEHGDKIDEGIVELAMGADLLIHEGQYTPEELPRFKGWGHSSWEQAVEVAERAGVKKLAITHHDPDHDDAFLRDVEKQCQARFPDAFLAMEKMESKN